ncbi:MAG: thiamine phosphate synthase [Bacteroidota bacterium]|nr:thiamine phosphate synthase [Bacteroidota bacterium]
MEDNKLIIIFTTNHQYDNEAEIISKMLKEGLSFIHLRKQSYSTKYVSELIEKIPSEFHKRIILHSHFKLLKKYDLGGVYFSEKKRKNKIYRLFFTSTIKKRKLIISISHKSTRKISKSPNYYSYFFLTSLFSSISENGKHLFKDKNKLLNFLGNTNRTIIAQGGIDILNIDDLKEVGFNGIALHSTIWRAKDPVKTFIEIKEKWLEQ